MQRSLSSSERSASLAAGGYTAEDFSFADAPRPFKNPYFQRTAATGKRTKSLKQIMILERERVDALLEAKKASVLHTVPEEPSEATPNAPPNEGVVPAPETERKLQQAFQQVVSFASVDAPPSLMPQKRYCDITGLEAKYQDPRSTLRYHNPEIYDILRTFQPAVIQAYLAVRGQGVVLR
ncbi:hypothetical protein JCM8202_005891 [Rhodotorula sphaerocarpa]